VVGAEKIAVRCSMRAIAMAKHPEQQQQQGVYQHRQQDISEPAHERGTDQ